VNGQQLLDGLDLHDHRIVHEQVNAISAVQSHSFVSNRNFDLPLQLSTTNENLATQALLVRRFQKSWTKSPVDFDRRSDHQFIIRCLDTFEFSMPPCLRGEHVFYLSFNVVSANSANTSDAIQNLTMTFDSDQPISSK
jgi:hypothetical protein